MPGPEAIALRWVDAGVLHHAAPPGIIGNGRQWVYTLGKAAQGVVLDNLMLAEKNPGKGPDPVGIPDVEIQSHP